MRTILAKDLKIRFIETMNEEENFTYQEGNPFLAGIADKQFIIFLKNLSSAYFNKSPDVTRIQLPFSKHFSEITKLKHTFIALGYDIDNDVFVSWNPSSVTKRLNAKDNVSLYSRSSLQEQVKDGEFKFGYLSNGEKIVLFKRENLIPFFDDFLNLFKESNTSNLMPLKNTADLKDSLSDKQRFIMWLQEKYSENTAKSYSYGIDKITKDLKVKSELRQKSLFEVKKSIVLKELYKKWIFILEFKNKDLIAKNLNSNSFKRFIEFREYEESLSVNQIEIKQENKTPNQRINPNVLAEITDRDLLQKIKPLLQKNRVLEAIAICMQFYKNTYKPISFKDCYTIVTNMYNSQKQYPLGYKYQTKKIIVPNRV